VRHSVTTRVTLSSVYEDISETVSREGTPRLISHHTYLVRFVHVFYAIFAYYRSWSARRPLWFHLSILHFRFVMALESSHYDSRFRVSFFDGMELLRDV
jgi:hypothetical protein